MYIHWKSLISLGFGVWTLLYIGDFLGEPSWKRYSSHIDDILKSQYNEIMTNRLKDQSEDPSKGLNWPLLIWNICAFLCSLIFFSVVRSASWVLWKLYTFSKNKNPVLKYFFAKKLVPTTPRVMVKKLDSNPEIANCKVLFKNQSYMDPKTQQISWQDRINAAEKQLGEAKKENEQLLNRLENLEKENEAIRNQMEEQQLESSLVRDKLLKTTDNLRANQKQRDFCTVNQELLSKKHQNLEQHLKEVSRDRDLYQNKLCNMEKNMNKLEEKLKLYQEQEMQNCLKEMPEKDTSDSKSPSDLVDSSLPEGDIDLKRIQQDITQSCLKTYRNIRNRFDSNSKISVDFDQSSVDTSKENDTDRTEEKFSNICKRTVPEMINQNLFGVYKGAMFKSKTFHLDNITEQVFSGTDTTASSSDEGPAPRRMISSTVEFQNFLKNLNSTTSFHKALY